MSGELSATPALASSASASAQQTNSIGYVGFGLYLGAATARDPDLLREQGITHIFSINHMRNSPKVDNNINKPYAPLAGDFNEVAVYFNDDDELGHSGDYTPIRETYERYRSWFEDATNVTVGHKCLVHCLLGRSRSVAICAYHLVDAKHHSTEEALGLLLWTRLDLKPRTCFIEEVKAAEELRVGTISFPSENLPGTEFKGKKQVRQLVNANRSWLSKRHVKIAEKKAAAGEPLTGSYYEKHRFLHPYE